MAQLRFKKLWITIGLLWLPFLPQVPGCVMANSPKVGRIVDATTGKGMPDVTVIAVASFFAQTAFHARMETPYRLITHTDTNGYYWLRGNWESATFALPWQEPRLSWVVTAFKPGYAIVGDEKSWSEFDKFGAPIYAPRSTALTPQSLWLGWIVKVDPIRMQSVKLGLKEEAVYYRRIITLGNHVSRFNYPDEVALRTYAKNTFLPKVCSEDPNMEMDYTETGSFMDLTVDWMKFSNRMKELAPMNWPQEIYARPKYKAGDVCQAMKAGER